MEGCIRTPVRCAAMAALVLSGGAGIGVARAADGPAPPSAAAVPSAADTPQPLAETAQPSSTVLSKDQIQGVLGKGVRSTAGEDMGRIVDVIVDHSGRARAAVIDFGGFLGVGSRKIAVAWNALHFTPDAQASVTLDLTRDQVKAAPEYKDGKPVVVLGASGSAEPMQDN
jgi:hypothetical protein